MDLKTKSREAAKEINTTPIIDYLGNRDIGDIAEIVEAAMREYAAAELAKVRELCLRHQHPGVVTGAHSLASAVLKIIGGAE